jgi:hypothetical protein
MTPAADYLAKARECEEEAKSARDRETREQWQALGRQWRELARQAKN